jgi:hypothetical protein
MAKQALQQTKPSLARLLTIQFEQGQGLMHMHLPHLLQNHQVNHMVVVEAGQQ